MINAITPNFNPKLYQNSPQQNSIAHYNNSPTFQGNQSILMAQKSSHKCEIMGRKFVNLFASLFGKKFVNEANALLSSVEKNSPGYIYAIANIGRVFSIGKEVEINLEDKIIEKIAQYGKPTIFIMNHSNQKLDPLMLGFFNTVLNEEYFVTDKATTCPRPRIILNEDILSTMRPNMRTLFEKLGAEGVDASLHGGNKVANGRKMAKIMKEYIDGESNIYIFPEGRNCIYKNKPLKERFQPGIANIIAKLISKTDVNVVPLGFAYNKSDKNLSSIQIGEPILFEKGVESDKDAIFDKICSALESVVNKAIENVPKTTMGDNVTYV